MMTRSLSDVFTVDILRKFLLAGALVFLSAEGFW